VCVVYGFGRLLLTRAGREIFRPSDYARCIKIILYIYDDTEGAGNEKDMCLLRQQHMKRYIIYIYINRCDWGGRCPAVTHVLYGVSIRLMTRQAHTLIYIYIHIYSIRDQHSPPLDGIYSTLYTFTKVCLRHVGYYSLLPVHPYTYTFSCAAQCMYKYNINVYIYIYIPIDIMFQYEPKAGVL